MTTRSLCEEVPEAGRCKKSVMELSCNDGVLELLLDRLHHLLQVDADRRRRRDKRSRDNREQLHF